MKTSTKTLPGVALALLLPCVGYAAAPAPTMCAKPDQPIFSCSLKGTQKTVSICAAGDVAKGSASFYYAYGSNSAKPELFYPARGAQVADPFTRTHLMFAGNTGGYAYAFVNGGFKYVVYAISGSDDQEDDGLIVMKDGEKKALKRTACEAGTITDSDNADIVRATLKWKKDPSIDQNGLPDSH